MEFDDPDPEPAIEVDESQVEQKQVVAQIEPDFEPLHLIVPVATLVVIAGVLLWAVRVRKRGE